VKFSGMILVVLLASNAVEGQISNHGEELGGTRGELRPGGRLGGFGDGGFGGSGPFFIGRGVGVGEDSQDEAGNDGGEALSNADQVEAGNEALDAEAVEAEGRMSRWGNFDLPWLNGMYHKKLM